jgi:hypothetical protein
MWNCERGTPTAAQLGGLLGGIDILAPPMECRNDLVICLFDSKLAD